MKASIRSQYEQLVLRSVEHARGTLDEALDLQLLGRKACLAPLHCQRAFRGLLADTPGELHRRLRVERVADRRLATSQHAVTRVALDAGYDTHASFTRAFAAAFGLSHFRVSHARCANPTAWSAAAASALPWRTGIHSTAVSDDTAVRFTPEQASMNVTVKFIPEKRVFAVAHRGPYNMIGAAFAKLDERLGASKLDKAQQLEMVALQYDDPKTVAAPELRADAGIVVSPEAALPDGLHELSIPAGRYACTLHQGPYDQLRDAWARFMGSWLVQSGHRVGTGPTYERYLNTPMNAAPHELLTELYMNLSEDKK
jgi:AraC family transcriptional regulator